MRRGSSDPCRLGDPGAGQVASLIQTRVLKVLIRCLIAPAPSNRGCPGLEPFRGSFNPRCRNPPRSMHRTRMPTHSETRSPLPSCSNVQGHHRAGPRVLLQSKLPPPCPLTPSTLSDDTFPAEPTCSVLDMCTELGVLHTVLDSTPYPFCLELAILASRWAQSVGSSSGCDSSGHTRVPSPAGTRLRGPVPAPRRPPHITCPTCVCAATMLACNTHAVEVGRCACARATSFRDLMPGFRSCV